LKVFQTGVMKRRVLLLVSLCLGAVLIIFSLYCSGKGKGMDTEAKKRQIYSSVGDDSDWERLGPPSPREWLAVFYEEGQTFEEYKRQVKNLKTEEKRTIYIQPLGVVDGRILKDIREYAELFFCVPALLNEPLSIPEDCYNERRRQFDTSKILQNLIRKRPKDALSYVAVMERDLYVENLNFVFGLGSFDERVGVYSLIRFRSDYRTLIRRALATMTHEIGHILSMKHCIFYKCLMCGSNSLTESDRRPIHLCPVCLSKLEWNLKFDRRERYQRLRDFYKRIGLDQEAEFAGRQSLRE